MALRESPIALPPFTPMALSEKSIRERNLLYEETKETIAYGHLRQASAIAAAPWSPIALRAMYNCRIPVVGKIEAKISTPWNLWY